MSGSPESRRNDPQESSDRLNLKELLGNHTENALLAVFEQRVAEKMVKKMSPRGGSPIIF